jgi:sugar phosphate isomerase/epimerase
MTRERGVEITMNITSIVQHVHVNMPVHLLLKQYFPLVLEKRLNLEIGFDCFALDTYGMEDYREAARILSGAGVRVTFHAPFYDLRPGALDYTVRNATVERIQQVFDLVEIFHPLSVVCHAAFDRRYYVSHEENWIENSITTWAPFVRAAAELGTVLMLENVYEDGPRELERLLEGLGDDPHVGICFDTGHWNAFSAAPLREWMDSLADRIGELHLHDNHGSRDEHLPAGAGTFPFRDFFTMLADCGRNPIVTVEPHKPEDLWKTLEYIAGMDTLPPGMTI